MYDLVVKNLLYARISCEKEEIWVSHWLVVVVEKIYLHVQFLIIFYGGSGEFQFIFCRQEESWVIDQISQKAQLCPCNDFYQ